MACILGLQRLCDDLLANRADVNLMSRIGTPLQCALGGPFLIACHDLSTRKTYSQLWNTVSTVEKTSTVLTQVLIEAGADCTRPLPAHYTWGSVGALGLKSSEWARDYQIFAEVVKGGAEMHDDAIHTFRLQCREWTKYKNERARSNVATILEVLQDMVLEGVHGALVYLTAFRTVVTDTHGIDSPLPALEAVADCMFIGKMKKAIEEDSLSALRETAESPRVQPLFQDDMLDDLLDDAVSHSAINCLSFLLARLSGSEAEEEKKGRLVLRCTHNAMEDVLLCLLRHGSKTTSTDSEGRNVWHLSTMGASSARIPRVLVLHAAADDRKIALHAQENCDGRTPLANAICKGDYEGVNIILQYCQANEAALQSTEPPVNNIISGIKSPEVLQRLHDGGFLPKPADETPLHALLPNCEMDGLRKLLEIYPYKDSLSLKSPVGCYFAATSFLCYKKDVLELLISTELPLSLNPHQRSIWSMVFDKLNYNLTHNNLVMAQIRWAPPLVDLLINTGCLAAHEAVSGVSALKEVESLLNRNIPINPRFRSNVIIPLEDIFVSVVNATADHPHLKSTELDIALLRWAAVRDSIDLVKLLLELGTSVHARGDNGNELSALELVCHHGPRQCSGGTLRKILEKSNKGALNNLHPYGDGDHVGLLHLHGHCNGLRTPDFYFAVILKWPQLGPPPPPPPPGMLLDEGCDPNILSQPGNKSPLLTHIVGQDMDSVQLLLQRGGATTVNTSDSSGWTLVAWACAYGWTFLLNDMVAMSDAQRIWDFEVAVWLHQHGSTPWKFKQAKALHIATIGSAETVVYLLNGRYVTEIDATTSNGTTPLHFATILGQIDSIRLLVSRGANIDAQNQNGSTPLHMAIKTKNITVIELLLNLGSKHLKNRQGQAPLDLTVAQNDRTITEILRDSIRGPSGTKDGTACNDKHSISAMRGAIQGAIERDDHDTVKRLLDEGCSPDIKMRPCRICPALLYALGRRPVSKRCVQLLIDQGASFKGMTCRQHQNWRRWHWPRSWPEGAESGDSSDSYSVTTSSETSSSSLECGRGQEWPFRGSTALDYFMEVSELEQNLETYLQAIPQLELKWLTQNSSPAYVSFENKSHKPLGTFLRHLQLMNSSLGRSLTKRVVTQVINRDGNTPLHMAASHENATMAKLVIKYGADVNAKNSSGSTPLHLAASSSDVAVIEALLDEGASMELRNGRGCTALQVAVGDNRIRAATVLLDRGARIDAIDDQNRFIFLGKMNTFRMLLNAGMSINHKGALSLLGLPVWASALFNVRTATFILNSDFASGIEVEPHKTALWRVWWNAQLVDEGSSRRCLPLFHRRLGFTFLRKLGEIENATGEGDNFSLLCLASHYGRVDEVKDLLRMRLNIEFEGSAAGTALMVAAHEGRMDIVKLLVSHGARIQYKRGSTWISALDAGSSFPDVVE
ncbi:ankyrin-2 ankyrin [Colletotrichum kahawae]|uniref:Ankyrin-2 ankyrin n=1 Tax=Colletotrichum kahawae TaxID=34407 RepID=A0AAD9YIT9_COLKA|nr:ankyrin-2 ankyrin [Colletotrichum kahawae]